MIWKVVVAFVALALAPAALVLGPNPMRVAEVRSIYASLTSAQRAMERDASLIAQVRARPWGPEVNLVSKKDVSEKEAKLRSDAKAFGFDANLLSDRPMYWNADTMREQAEIIHRRLDEVESSARTRVVLAHVLLVVAALAALWALVQRKQGTTRAGGLAVAGALIPLLWLSAMASMSTTFMIGFIASCFVLLVSGFRTFVTPAHGRSGATGTGGVTP